jgi:predicted Zn-dependent protease
MNSILVLNTVLRRACIAISIAGLSMVLVYCGSVNIFPVAQDKQLGAQFDQEIRANPKEYPILNNAAARSYVQSMVDRLVQSPEVRYRNQFAYKAEIINDDNTINAFCTPGGYIYVYTGLIKMLDNEAALAGVMGHEIAHAERRHSTSRMTKQLGVSVMMDMVLGQNPDRHVALAANAFAGLGLLKNSRSDELESDDYSFRYLRSTNWYPGAINFFFEKVKGRGGSAIERLLSTHPLPQDRIDATNERLKKNNIPPPTPAQLNATAYAEFKRRL